MQSQEQTIWWHVYPLGFCGAPIRDADPTQAPRLRQLTAWLDYAANLGATGLLLGPVFASQSHGYDTLDQFRIDPRLGTDHDFTELVTAAHERGMRILLDGVFSHVGAAHPDVRRALQEGPNGSAAGLFDIDWHAPDGPSPRVFEGHQSLVRLNHHSQQAVEYTQAVMRHWLARGIDGWRLDAAYSVSPDFWSRVLPAVRGEFPGSWFLGEMIHGDYAQFVRDSGVDTVTQYELWKSIWSAIKDRNLYELDGTLSRHGELLDTFTPQTFVGNHDTTRIASLVGADGAVAALAVLLTVGGTPSIYYGDEQGFVGVKENRLGGDDDVRPSFPAHPDELADWGQHIHRAHRELIDLRRQNPWLTRARTAPLHLENQRYVYRVSAEDGSRHFDVQVDLGDAPRVTVWGENGQVVWAQS